MHGAGPTQRDAGPALVMVVPGPSRLVAAGGLVFHRQARAVRRTWFFRGEPTRTANQTMNKLTTRVLSATATLCAALSAQGPDFLITYSQPEVTLSGSNGTPLQFLLPNEISHLEYSNGPCSSLSAEKWSPRACYHAMAGDENSNAMYWNPTLFGAIDALVEGISPTPIGGTNPRTVFISPAQALGNGVSALPLRPGDIGRIVRNSSGDGQVEYFLRQDEINIALGLPPNTPIDVDAAAFTPGHGVFLSLDQDHFCFPQCGPTFLQDGAIFMIPSWAITYTWDFRVQSVLPNSAFVVYTEAQVDAMVVSAQITNRFGTCLTNAIDLEALDIDWMGGGQTIVPCAGAVLQVPDLIFSVATATGAGLLTTQGGGTIYNGMCGGMARGCGGGPTFGPQSGIQPTSATVGAPSYVNAICSTWTLRYALQARTPVLTSPVAAGVPVFDINSPAPWNFVFVTFVPSGVNAVPTSFPSFPFSLLGFPDYYPTPTFYNMFGTTGGTCTFAVNFPLPFPMKILFQSVGVVNTQIEFSTPAILDVQ